MPVSAQDKPQSAADIAVARSLGIEGIKLAESGDCAAAIDRLGRAESIYHAPTILERLGECQIALGRVVAGTENLQRVVRERLPPHAPQAFVLAQERAKQALERSVPKIAKIKIHLEAPTDAKPMVRMDGESIPLATLDVDRPADPGKHLVEASAPGYRTTTAEVLLAEGGAGAANLLLSPEAGAAPNAPPVAAAAPIAGAPPPSAALAAPPPAPGGPVPPPPPPPAGPDSAAAGAPPVFPLQPGPRDVGPASPGGSSASKTLGFVLIGVGGFGVAAGSVLGLVALGKKAGLDAQCGNRKGDCPPAEQTNIDSMKSFASGSTIGFAAGGAGLAVGLVLVLASGGSTSPAAAPPPPPPQQGLSLGPYLGPGSAGIRGAF